MDIPTLGPTLDIPTNIKEYLKKVKNSGFFFNFDCVLLYFRPLEAAKNIVGKLSLEFSEKKPAVFTEVVLQQLKQRVINRLLKTIKNCIVVAHVLIFAQV